MNNYKLIHVTQEDYEFVYEVKKMLIKNTSKIIGDLGKKKFNGNYLRNLLILISIIYI